MHISYVNYQWKVPASMFCSKYNNILLGDCFMCIVVSQQVRFWFTIDNHMERDLVI